MTNGAFGTDWTALMSDSCPVNVCTAFPDRTSQTLAVASHAPETNRFWFDDRDSLERRKGRAPTTSQAPSAKRGKGGEHGIRNEG